MKTVLTLYITAFILAACVAPQPLPEKPSKPYLEDNVALVVQHGPNGEKLGEWVPKGGQITVDPLSDTISFQDQKGTFLVISPSFSVEYNR